MVNTMNCRTPVAWPRARAGYNAEPAFHIALSAQHAVDMSSVLHAVASRMQTEYVSALRMYCAGQPSLAKGYLLRAEHVYTTYGKQENYELVPAHIPDVALYNRGHARTYAAWIELALHGRWSAELLQSGLQDLHDYLMTQSYDSTRAYEHEDQDRLFTVLCQMALGDFDTAGAWLDGYIKHRKLKKLKENFPELLAGIQAQLQQGPSVVAEPFKAYFDQNRLGIYKFAETQSFWLCVPMAVVMERMAKGWQGPPVWDDVLEYLLY